MAPYSGWTCPASDVEIVSNWQATFDYDARSQPFLPPDKGEDHKFELGVFEGRALSETTSALWHWDKAQGGASVNDACLYTGGAAWCLDWCPGAGSADRQAGLLAVGVHPRSRQRNRLGERFSGPALLQLWRVSAAGPPTLAMAIAHEGGVTWDVKWRPAGAASAAAAGAGAGAGASPHQQQQQQQQQQGWEDGGGSAAASAAAAAAGAEEGGKGRAAGGQGQRLLPCVGQLAAALADGRIVLYNVPLETSIPHGSSGGGGGGGRGRGAGASSSGGAGPSTDPSTSASASSAPLVVRLRPVAELSPPTGSCSPRRIPNCLDWLPTWPHDLLLAGCWDGCCLVVRAQPCGGIGGGGTGGGGGAAALQVLSCFEADPLPLRTVGWARLDSNKGAGGTPIKKEGGGGGDGEEHQEGGEERWDAAVGDVAAMQRSLFFTGGQQGALRLWDARSPCIAVAELSPSRQWVLCGAFAAHPPVVVFGMDDGTLRLLTALCTEEHSTAAKGKETLSRSMRNLSNAAVWSVDVWHAGCMAAYGGGLGEVFAFPLIIHSHVRNKAVHIAIGAVQRVDDEASTAAAKAAAAAVTAGSGKSPKGGSAKAKAGGGGRGGRGRGGRGGRMGGGSGGSGGRGGGKKRKAAAAGSSDEGEDDDSHADDESWRGSSDDDGNGGGGGGRPSEQRAAAAGGAAAAGRGGGAQEAAAAGEAEGERQRSAAPPAALRLMSGRQARLAMPNPDALAALARVPDDAEAVYRVRWLQSRGRSTWLAYATASGLVRVQAVPRDAAPGAR